MVQALDARGSIGTGQVSGEGVGGPVVPCCAVPTVRHCRYPEGKTMCWRVASGCVGFVAFLNQTARI